MLQEFLGEQGMNAGAALDLGAGQGRDAHMLAQHGFAVTAVDISSVSMRQLDAATRATLTPIQCEPGDVVTYRYPTARFQLVNASTLLDHLPSGDIPTVAGGIMRALAPGGLGHVMVFTERDPGFQVWMAHQEHARTRMSETADAIEHYFTGTAELRALFAGMDILHCIEFACIDRSHGMPHDHHIATILFRKPADAS
jgi:SAM-dependent methyltransferase